MMIRELGAQLEQRLRADHSKWLIARNQSSTALGGVAVLFGCAMGATSLQWAAVFSVAAGVFLFTSLGLLLRARRSSKSIRSHLTMLQALRGVARDAGANEQDVQFIDSLNKALRSEEIGCIARGKGALL